MMAEMDARESDNSEEIPEDEFQVERICRVRIRGGKKEFFLKWKGYPEEENTWEPEDNLDCPELIRAFEDRMAKERASSVSPAKPSTSAQKGASKIRLAPEIATDSSRKRGRSSTEDEVANSKTPDEPAIIHHKGPSKTIRGFARGLKPDRIIGATDSSGELMFLIKWKDSTEADLVPAREANVKCPQTVIRFYEERLTWHTPEPAVPAASQPTTPAPSTNAPDEGSTAIKPVEAANVEMVEDTTEVAIEPAPLEDESKSVPPSESEASAQPEVVPETVATA